MLKHIHRGLWLTAGILSVLIGFAGILLPVLPGFFFFLLALACFMRCSQRFNALIRRRRWYVRLRALRLRHRRGIRQRRR